MLQATETKPKKMEELLQISAGNLIIDKTASLHGKTYYIDDASAK